MTDYLYIVTSRAYRDDFQVPIMMEVESVWSTAQLAESAVRYYESINPPKSKKFYVVERPINAIVRGKE